MPVDLLPGQVKSLTMEFPSAAGPAGPAEAHRSAAHGDTRADSFGRGARDIRVPGDRRGVRKPYRPQGDLSVGGRAAQVSGNGKFRSSIL